MSTIIDNNEKLKLYCKQFSVMGNLDVITSPDQMTVVCICDYHILDANGDLIPDGLDYRRKPLYKNKGLSIRKEITFNMEDLLGVKNVFDLMKGLNNAIPK